MIQLGLGSCCRNTVTQAMVIACMALFSMGRAVADDRQPLAIDPDVLAAQQRRIDVMERASRATIAIFGLKGEGGGSGVIITPDGYALTNYHVSSACGDHMRCGLNDGTMVDAVIVGIDATGDVALIQLLGRDDFPTAPLGNSDLVRVGQWCFAAGNPFVLATNRQPSVSLGIVSGVGRYQYPAGTLLEYADCIQTDAAVNPGNSGGPLFDLNGNVIGINGRCSFEKRGRVNVGVGYAISANQIKYFLGGLRSGRLVDHATLGATVTTDDVEQVVVSNILNNSDAYRRGLRFGDQVLRLADREVRTTNGFKNILGTLPKDWRVPIEIRRDGKQQTLLVRLDGVHTEQELIELVKGGLEPKAEHEEPQPNEPGKPKEDDAQKDSSEHGDATESAKDQAAPQPRAAGEPDAALVASMLETRPGYANYYFNRQSVERLSGQLAALGPFASNAATWKLSGKMAAENTAAALSISTEVAELQLGSRSLQVAFNDELSDIVAARREGGLLLAMRALQQCLQGGLEKMGATSYLGQFPVYQTTKTELSQQPLHDVVQVAWYDTSTRLYVDPETGLPSLIEIYGDAGVDPIEVYFDKFQTISMEGKEFQFPHRLRLQYSPEPMLVIDLDSIELVPPSGAEQ